MRNLFNEVGTILLVLVLATGAYAGIQSGPYLQNVATDGVTVCVTSTGPDATVEYGLDDSYGDTAYSDTAIDIEWDSRPLFQVRIDGLSPATVYHYRVISGGDTTPDRQFTTTVNSGDPFLFCAYGDNRRPSPWAAEAVANEMAEEFPDFVINTGDIVNFDEQLGVKTAAEWKFFFEKTVPLISQSPLFAIRGNHDDDSDLFMKFMDNPTDNSGNEHYYSFDYGNAHFLALDSTLEECSGAQLAFVESDLAANEGNGPLFVFFHHPPFSNGTHGGSGSTYSCWAPLFQEYGVDMVFSGHDHLYTRMGTYYEGGTPPAPGINGVTYIVTGGGGAPLYPTNTNNTPPIDTTAPEFHFLVVQVSGDAIDVTVKLADGETELEHFALDATANDGQFDRNDGLPPKGDGGTSCGTIPGDSRSGRLAIGLYLFPALFLVMMKGRIRRQQVLNT